MSTTKNNFDHSEKPSSPRNPNEPCSIITVDIRSDSFKYNCDMQITSFFRYNNKTTAMKVCLILIMILIILSCIVTALIRKEFLIFQLEPFNINTNFDKVSYETKIFKQSTMYIRLNILSQHEIRNNRNKRKVYENYIGETSLESENNYFLRNNYETQPPNSFNYFLDYNSYYNDKQAEDLNFLYYNPMQANSDNENKVSLSSYGQHNYNLEDTTKGLGNVTGVTSAFTKRKRIESTFSEQAKKPIKSSTEEKISTPTRHNILHVLPVDYLAYPNILRNYQNGPYEDLLQLNNKKTYKTFTDDLQLGTTSSYPKQRYNIEEPNLQDNSESVNDKTVEKYSQQIDTTIPDLENKIRFVSVTDNDINIKKHIKENVQETLEHKDTGDRKQLQQNTKMLNNESRTNVETDLRSKSKTDGFSAANEDVQINQQTLINPCFYPYHTQFGPLNRMRFDGSQILKVVPINSPKMPQYIFNPPIYPYMQMPHVQPQYYFPNYGLPVHQFYQEQRDYTAPLQVSSPSGQYYMCNPISTPTNNIAMMPGIEVRREASNLQDVMETIPGQILYRNNTMDIILTCPNGQQSCSDGSRCISKQHICDNEVNCDDGSDELFCSCKNRVGKLRICDGYSDCPNSEDEQECFGCAENEFSCDDWSKFRKSTCIPLEQRCDNIKHCEVTGKDEEDCVVLSDYIGIQSQFKISNSVGFLHRNYKGRWYPICLGTNIWAKEVCKIESGPSIINPRLNMMLTSNTYNDDFINIFPNNDVNLVKTCVQDRAAFVECPPLYCGLRIMIKNPYRPYEIDTSAEDELERLAQKPELSYNETNSFEFNVLGERRVVGGRPSQPAAWPWLVSIYKNGIFHCGGVLMNDLWVVTAAHCVDRYWQYYYEIQAGMLRRFSYSPMEQRRWAAIVKPHEHYDKNSLLNDIALIKLSSPVRYNRYVRPICLPSEATAGRDFLRGPPPGTLCTTIGWGATVEHGSDPDHMREVEIPVLEHCNKQEDRVGDDICAGLFEGGKDACQGDSGGPFMCRNPNNPSQWYLAGIVSHGEGCARPNEPGVYTKVSKFIEWIAENIKTGKYEHKMPLQKCPGYICKGIKKCLPKKRRCDKIVDCLLGDDEMNCDHYFHDIFIHSSKTNFVGYPLEKKDNYRFMDGIMPDIEFNNKTTSLGITTKNTFSRMEVEDKVKSKPATSSHRHQKKTTMENKHYFKCKSMLQIIPIIRKCDKLVDCEDGTDELRCLCADYVKNYNRNAICDGITDCYDISDEIDCVKCKTSEYYCRQSKTCIDRTRRCNGVTDCLKNEDEIDCVALTDGVTLTLDSDLRPKLSMNGIITINRFGVWRPLCANISDNEASIATNVCNLLGFEEYIEFHKYQVKDKPLNVTIEGFKQANYMDAPCSMCSGLYVRCSEISLNRFAHKVYQDNITDNFELYTLPWNAVIYSDGIYKCMGTILNARWIVTSFNCFEISITLKRNYVVALLGKGKSQLKINGPHEQILRVTKVVNIEGSDVTLLCLEYSIIFTRYIQPVNINTRMESIRKEKCIAVGLEGNKAKYVLLHPITNNCSINFRCVESKVVKNCQSSSAWSGAIVCDSGNGWYPAAIYHEKTGYCGLTSVNHYTNLKFLKSKILNVMEQVADKIDVPVCDGFRCKLGECILRNKVCNEIPDCRGGEDEHPDVCHKKEMECHRTDSCVCPLSYMKCKNNKCIPKTAFCNRINDCGDTSDEPDVCSCKEYLKLTHPTKICDGIIHCMDRSDEDPTFCTCKLDSFKCGNTSYCVSQDMVCDGIEDCPNGEDEIKCITLRTEEDKRSNEGEVLRRTGGVWHSGCFKLNYTTTELRKICYDLGFPSGNVSQLPPRNLTSPLALRPELDGYSVVWIHRIPGNKLYLRIRTGNEPYVKFVSDPNCYKLFVICI